MDAYIYCPRCGENYPTFTLQETESESIDEDVLRITFKPMFICPECFCFFGAEPVETITFIKKRNKTITKYIGKAKFKVWECQVMNANASYSDTREMLRVQNNPRRMGTEQENDED